MLTYGRSPKLVYWIVNSWGQTAFKLQLFQFRASSSTITGSKGQDSLNHCLRGPHDVYKPKTHQTAFPTQSQPKQTHIPINQKEEHKTSPKGRLCWPKPTTTSWFQNSLDTWETRQPSHPIPWPSRTCYTSNGPQEVWKLNYHHSKKIK